MIRSVDVIGDALASMRVSGSVLLREAYRPPWGVAIPASDRLATLLHADPGARVVAFHLVVNGSCQLAVAGRGKQILTAGQVALCFGGPAHTVSDGSGSKPQPLEELLKRGGHLRRAGEMAPASTTSLLCGAFQLRHTEFNPLFAAMPALMTATVGRHGDPHSLSGAARLLAEEIDRRAPAGDFIIARLLEVFCAEAIRSHVSAATSHETGWLRGLHDPVVGGAIASIHDDPGRRWSVEQLANNAAISPSRFAARFTATIGESPMAYVSKWRMNVARHQLAGSRHSVERIAADVGYESLAAFNRAFRKIVGMPPARWRAEERRAAGQSGDSSGEPG